MLGSAVDEHATPGDGERRPANRLSDSHVGCNRVRLTNEARADRIEALREQRAVAHEQEMI